jgi:alkylated DNA repair dioxygenase AlkB
MFDMVSIQSDMVSFQPDDQFILMAKEMILLREATFDLSKRFDQLYGLDKHFKDLKSDDVDDIIDNDFAQLKGAIECNFGNFRGSNTGNKTIEAIHSFSSIHDSEISTPAEQEIEIETICSDDRRIETICSVDSQPVAVQCELAYTDFLPDIFKYFSADSLEKSTEFTHVMSNRKAVYYGKYPYSYGNNTHSPQDISNNPYLEKLLCYVDIVFPHLEFNSIMIHQYKDGNDYMPHHSDDEEEIADNSTILTISLGGSRLFEFNDKSSGLTAESVELTHGSCLLMSKNSQKNFTHSVPKCESARKRLSVTLRLINPQDDPKFIDVDSECNKSHCSIVTANIMNPEEKEIEQVVKNLNVNPTDSLHESDKPPHPSPPGRSEPNSSSPITTIYIGDSIFRHLNGRLLSSESQNARVFFYPGANSHQMLDRLYGDPEFQKLNKKKVYKIVLLTGTNYVDSIENNIQNLTFAMSGIEMLAQRIWADFANAQLYITNLLPRAVLSKNNIVDEMNRQILRMCKTHGLYFIDTEVKNRLFTDTEKKRRDKYFNRGFDNVHLNRFGVARLGRHFKYITHKCSIQD